MDENITRERPDRRSFEERVFARFDALDERMSMIDERLSSLEEKVDRRLQETRPIWEGVQAKLEHIDTKLDVVIGDLYEMRTDLRMLDKRVNSLEGTRP
ncbi:MAG: hypothetical protein WCF57_11725 [Pyrinomonadaceae bacterium]